MLVQKARRVSIKRVAEEQARENRARGGGGELGN
jgi:hypothetical protein